MAEPVLIIPRPDTVVGTAIATGGGEGGAATTAIGSLLFLLPLIPLSLSLMGLSTSMTLCPVCTTPTPCTTPAPCVPTPACPSGYIKLTNQGQVVPDKCYFFSESTQNFINSQVLCSRMGGRLVNPTTIPEGEAIRTYLQANGGGQSHYAGYTDFGQLPSVIGLAGGPIVIPVFGTRANSAGYECWALKVVGNIPSVEYDECKSLFKAICQVDLSLHTCVCG